VARIPSRLREGSLFRAGLAEEDNNLSRRKNAECRKPGAKPRGAKEEGRRKKDE
jgi:hypothetical protein